MQMVYLITGLVLLVYLVLVWILGSALHLKAPDIFKAKFSTTQGDFVVQVTRVWAPLGADRQRSDLLLPLFGKGHLAQQFGSLLSLSGRVARVENHKLRSILVSRNRWGLRPAKKMSVRSGWLALVPWDAGPGNRLGASRGTVNRRPLHVPPNDWTAHFDRLGRARSRKNME